VTRVVVVDDQAMVRTGLRMVLEAEADLEVVGEAADGEEAIRVVSRCDPDVVLMDIRMPRLDGIAAARALLDRGCAARVLMLTTFNEDDYLYAALRAGTSGFLLKEAPPEQLVDAVRVVAAGDALLAPAVTRRVIEEFARSAPRGEPPAALGELTAREREVLELLGRGLSNAEIAGRLIISEATAKTHVGRVLMKLHLRDRAQAVVFAYEAGVVRPGATTPEP
jgi:DNA-binding NarL/FixJ family response regulator